MTPEVTMLKFHAYLNSFFFAPTARQEFQKGPFGVSSWQMQHFRKKSYMKKQSEVTILSFFYQGYVYRAVCLFDYSRETYVRYDSKSLTYCLLHVFFCRFCSSQFYRDFFLCSLLPLDNSNKLYNPLFSMLNLSVFSRATGNLMSFCSYKWSRWYSAIAIELSKRTQILICSSFASPAPKILTLEISRV